MRKRRKNSGTIKHTDKHAIHLRTNLPFVGTVGYNKAALKAQAGKATSLIRSSAIIMPALGGKECGKGSLLRCRLVPTRVAHSLRTLGV